MNQGKYRPRLSTEITEHQDRELRRLIPWGIKRELFSIIVDDVIRLAKKHGQVFIAAILQKGIKVEDYSSLELEGEDETDL